MRRCGSEGSPPGRDDAPQRCGARMRFIVSAACRARLSPAGAEIAERYGTRTVVLGATHDFSPSLAAGR